MHELAQNKHTESAKRHTDNIDNSSNQAQLYSLHVWRTQGRSSEAEKIGITSSTILNNWREETLQSEARAE